ncbi:hypothetical protein QYF61_004791 [Mycteria americana]|uniref:Uncharacterized protein n=1 Tax=Mycteria americana TaxID=33587 RepID=A0AAN7N4W1_MYCAM|nr:hypothetical protein QYF61_004791 [Mycteria americana]
MLLLGWNNWFSSGYDEYLGDARALAWRGKEHRKAMTQDFKAFCNNLIYKDRRVQAKQSQFPQPLLIRLLLQTLHQLRCPSLDTLQHLNVSLVVRGPKLNTGFEVRPHQCRVQGHDHFPTPAGHAIFDTSQDAIGFLGHLGTLLAHIQLSIDQHPQVLFCLAAFQPLLPKPVALHGVAVAEVQDLALGLVERHTIDLSPSIQPVQVPLKSLPTLKQINTPTQLGVICKLTEGALDLFIQIIDKDIKQNWSQHRALGNTTCDRPPTGVNSFHHHSLGPAIQLVLYPAKSTPVQAMSSQFLQENASNTDLRKPRRHYYFCTRSGSYRALLLLPWRALSPCSTQRLLRSCCARPATPLPAQPGPASSTATCMLAQSCSKMAAVKQRERISIHSRQSQMSEARPAIIYNPQKGLQQFDEWYKQKVTETQFSKRFPVSEFSLLPFQKFYMLLSKACKSYVPPTPVVDETVTKKETSERLLVNNTGKDTNIGKSI